MRAATSPQTLMSSAQSTEVYETPRVSTCSFPVALMNQADLTTSMLLCIFMTLYTQAIACKIITTGHAV
jgi:hypothetical protein